MPSTIPMGATSSATRLDLHRRRTQYLGHDKGRVILAGDAARGASPYSGMGVSGGLVGAYVLGRSRPR